MDVISRCLQALIEAADEDNELFLTSNKFQTVRQKQVDTAAALLIKHRNLVARTLARAEGNAK